MITATDLVALVGVDPYGRTAHDIYLAKVAEDEPPEEQSDAFDVGNALEPVALSLLARKRGLELVPGKTETHPFIPWIGATPDASVVRHGWRVAVAEAKCVGYDMRWHWGRDDAMAPPDYVVVQVEAQIVVTRTLLGYVSALFGTEHRIFEVHHDGDLSTALLELADAFWRKHVVPRVPPPVDGSGGAARMVRQLFRDHDRAIICAPPEADGLVSEYLEAKRIADVATARAELAQTKLCALIGEHEGVCGPGWTATWKKRASGGTDWKGLATSLGAKPEQIAAFGREGSRVFCVKEARR